MHVCMHVCMYACMHVCIYVWMYFKFYVCMYVCMHACMYVYMYGCILNFMYVCMYVCMHACMHVCRYICTFRKGMLYQWQGERDNWNLHVNWWSIATSEFALSVGVRSGYTRLVCLCYYIWDSHAIPFTLALMLNSTKCYSFLVRLQPLLIAVCGTYTLFYLW